MLETARLNLRPFVSGDADDLFSILGSDGVFQYFPPGPAPKRETAVRLIESTVAHWDRHGYGLWAVESRRTGNLLGRCGLQYLPETDEIEVDFLLDPSEWGKGYATEAGRASLGFGFDVLDADEIVGIVHPDNLGSRRVLEKIGMTHTRRDEYFGMTMERYALTR